MSVIGSLTRRLFALTPYELRRRDERVPPEEGAMENIELALAYYSASGRSATFVQIGACDGMSGDSTYQFIKRGQMRAVLVEPIQISFRKLQHAYQDVSDVTLVRAAIAERDGEAGIYKVKEGASSIDPYWAHQLASFSRQHLLKFGVAAADIEEERVPALTLSSLMAKCNLEEIDILQVDTEGFDGEVVKMALNLPTPPECINFEHLHLKAEERKAVYALLKQHGYDWTHDRWNTLALHERMRMRWR